LPKLDWGKGIWQKVKIIQELRKNCVHRFLSENELFPNVQLAEEALEIIGKAVREVYQHVNKPIPTWIKDNYDQGWAVKSGFTIEANGHDSPYNNVPCAVKITYVYKDKEIIFKILAPDSDPEPDIQYLINEMDRPISAIKVYVNNDLISEKSFEVSKIRGY
jgi:hypothetical protein